MYCQNCGENIPDFPEEKVERTKISEVVGHKHNKSGNPAISTKDYYCNPQCFVEAFTEGDDE